MKNPNITNFTKENNYIHLLRYSNFFSVHYSPSKNSYRATVITAPLNFFCESQLSYKKFLQNYFPNLGLCLSKTRPSVLQSVGILICLGKIMLPKRTQARSSGGVFSPFKEQILISSIPIHDVVEFEGVGREEALSLT